jgi:hypothetical protein
VTFDFRKSLREAMTGTFEEMLDFMRLHGSSVILNWGEDGNGKVECSWITGGDRYTGFGSEWASACWVAMSKCHEKGEAGS